MRDTPHHILTFDIEEWFHLVGVKAMDDRSRWDDLEPTVEPLTDRILALLDDCETKATFFVLGWVAQRYPGLVRRIAERGHEVGSHSYWHYEVYKHTPGSFRADLRRSIGVIEDACGQRVRGYRAPSFSLTPGCEWAWDVMLELGIAYDASVFPVARAHGGYPCSTHAKAGAGMTPSPGPEKGDKYIFKANGKKRDSKRDLSPFIEMPTPAGRVMRVLPMSVTRLPVWGAWSGKRLAFSGGGYFRVWPWRLVARGFAEHAAAGRPAVAYLHPWDFAPGGPALPMRPHQRFKCYFHRDQTEGRLRKLLGRYTFGPVRA